MSVKREYGDYQTPLDFALRVCTFLKEQKHLNPSMIFEPTCGIGNFLTASKIFDARKYFGIEINPLYCKICIENFADERLTVFNENFFTCESELLPKDSNLLVIGNPPWATNSSLSKNLPQKFNVKNFKGLEALTGASNFDICEYIISYLIEKYRDTNTALAVLCKTSVARNVFKSLWSRNVPFVRCETFEFDAGKVFGISASACLLFIQLTEENCFPSTCNVYNFDNPEILKSSFGYRGGKFYSNLSASNYDIDGESCFEWRQGIKHDCSKIVELTKESGILKNGYHELVDVEEELIFPMVKGSAIKIPIIRHFSKYLLVTQKFLGEDTTHLELDAPKAWQYLRKNATTFKKRKSKIYNNSPQFAMFGIGDYSYLPYKVCIGGFNKEPFFSLIYSEDIKPVMLDDTTYFLGFDDYGIAYTAMIYLNSIKVREFLQSLSFADSKRPYTKKILSRVDFSKIYHKVSFSELKWTETELNLPNYLTENILENFFDLINSREQNLF